MQPTAQGVQPPYGSRFADQDQKSRLASVLGVLMMAEDAPAYFENQWAIALIECSECGLIMLLENSLQQLSVVGLRRVPQRGEPSQSLGHVGQCLRSHGSPPA